MTKRLGEILNSTAGVALGQSETRVTALQKVWGKVLSPDMARSTRPIRLIRDHLEVDVLVSLTAEENAELDNQLSMVLPHYGVHGVSYRMSGRPDVGHATTERVSSAARAKVASIKDPALSSAMAKLITAFDRDPN